MAVIMKNDDEMSETPRSSDPVKLIDQNLFEYMLHEAHASPRKRKNFNFHPTLQDNPHRFLNVMLRGTYVTPHRHLTPPKPESFLVLQGALLFFIFNDDGSIREMHRLGGENNPVGIDIEAGLWHTLVVDGDHAIIYEVKPGPYDPSEDKQFAPFAPHEGEAGTAEYLNSLIAYGVG